MESSPNQQIVLSGLARQLVNDGLLNDTTAKEVVIDAKQKKERFITRLVNQEYISAKAIANCCATNIGFPLFDLQQFNVKTLEEDDLISPKLCIEHHFVPLLKRGSRLYIAISDPMQTDLFDKIKFHVRLNPSPIIVEEDKLQRILEQLSQTATTAALGDIDDESLSTLETSGEENVSDTDTAASEEDAPIVRFINKIILSAIQKGASDIHFEPYEKHYRIRFRLDGILTEIANPTHKMATRFAARLKVMSRLDLSERRVPQDGRFKLKISHTRSIDFRISTCPTLYGEKVVLRVLDNENTQLDFDTLGIKERYQHLLLHHIKRPQGMVLVTGPTGSGKTVTLYTCLNLLNDTEKNISTVEDPVEINLPGINQVHVNLKAGLTFPAALRSFLRQDPDIIMVGEIRDLETAEIAIKAAQTGHLVFSTLHTNSSTETLTRLVNMGVPAFNIATSVSLIVAQRLVRRLCKHCKKPAEIPEKALLHEGFQAEQISEATFFKAIGCDQCNKGFKGRVGVYEMLEMSDDIGQLIMKGGNAMDIAKLAQKSEFRTLRQAGLDLVAEGLTSLEEIERITVN